MERKHHLEPLDHARRSVVGGMMSVMFWPLLAACIGNAKSTGTLSVPERKRGNARLSVVEWGARGDGVQDDTGAFQRAIDALPAEGGTVLVPAGRYLIDPLAKLRLRSAMHLQLSPQTELIAKSNAAERAYVLLVQDVSDVEISGGKITGDRKRHLGTKGEWGHGIAVRGVSRVTIRDILIRECWGDGISIGANPALRGKPAPVSEDVVVARVVCTGNRRQGLTVGGARRVVVQDSEFSDTAGTAPAAGIDLEPDSVGGAQNIRIERCLLRNNRGPGIQVYKRVSDVRIENCTIRDNGNSGVLTVGASGIVIAGNRIGGNARRGIDLGENTRDALVKANVFRGSSANPLSTNKPWQTQVRVAASAQTISLAGDNRTE